MFPSEKLTGRIVSPSVIHYFIHYIPSTIISLVCLTSRLTDFGCNPVIRCDKCTSFTTFIPKSTVVFFVYSPSQTKLNPLFFLWVYIPCSTFLPLSWTGLLLVTLHLVCCFVNLPRASQTYYSMLINAICFSELYDTRYVSSPCICHQFWLSKTILSLKNVELYFYWYLLQWLESRFISFNFRDLPEVPIIRTQLSLVHCGINAAEVRVRWFTPCKSWLRNLRNTCLSLAETNMQNLKDLCW